MRSTRTKAFRSLSALAALMLIAPAIPTAVAAPTTTNDVKQGVDAWESGDYQRAVAIWRPLALDGNPDAQFNLGQAYKLGRGVPADLAQAEGWYRRATKQGHLQAEDNLGLVLFTANRREEAMPFIIRSAGRGEPRAQYVLGTAHFNGDLAAHDWPRAYALTKRASDAGLGIASARLAQLDTMIPLEQRQRGLAMLPEIERQEQRERLAAVNAAAPTPTKPALSPVQAARLPVSLPGATYTPPPTIAPTAVRPLSPAGVSAATAASEAAAAATAAASTQARTVPQPIQTAALPASTPTPMASEAGTSFPAPPASGDLPPAIAPKPTPAAPPKPQPAAAAAPVRPAADIWRAQLGAFSNESNARNLWAALEKKHPALAANQPYLFKTGRLTRVQAGNFATKSDADAFCASVKSASQPCVVMAK